MSLAVRTLGAGSPMLLLHGFTGSSSTWGSLLEAWAERHRVIAPDLLGHGHSDAPHDPLRYALERQARELAGLLASLDATTATVIGYSMGARLALVLALAYPDRVERLVLESPSAGVAAAPARDRRRAADERLADMLEDEGIVAFVDHWQSLPLFSSHADLPDSTRAAIRAERLSQDPAALVACLRGAGQGTMEPLYEQLPMIAIPVLVISGGRDSAGLARARVVADLVPGARLEVVDGAGHTPHLESPSTFGALVADFMPTTHPTH